MKYAENLIQGFYSPPGPDIFLWNGPGLPILLIPFAAFQLPLVLFPLLNAVFHYLSIVFVYKSLELISSRRSALCFALIWAFYYNAYKEMPLIYTESMTICMLSVVAWCVIRIFTGASSRKLIVLAGLLLGYIVLTKIIFGYVLLALIGLATIGWLLDRRSDRYRKALLILLIGFAVNLPYLFYTYQLTGKKFYWGNSGGMSLYWMSTPYPEEYGEWHNDHMSLDVDPARADSNVLYAERRLRANHQADYDEIFQYRGVARDDAFKRIAIRNIRNNPRKFIENCISNAGRMIFNYPYSYTYETNHTLLRVVINGIILTTLLLSLILSLLNWRKMAFPVIALLVFTGIYLGASVLVSAYARMYYVILPVLLIWAGYVFFHTVKISLRFTKNT
jgi:4-amino-4-deoxy-L-arabinose transferase-like glycosyltransferase